MTVFFLILSCISLQAQMYIGNEGTVTLKGNSSIISDSIIVESSSNSISSHTVKKAGKYYVLSGSDKSLASVKDQSELGTKKEKVAEKNTNESLVAERSPKISRPNVPDPKPQTNSHSKSWDNFKSKAEKILFATAGNPISTGKKAGIRVDLKKKIAPIICSVNHEKSGTFFLNNVPLTIYLKSFRSRPPPLFAMF